MTRPLIGKSSIVIEHFVVSRVLRQYGRLQSISQEFTAYAIFVDEQR